MEPIDFSKAIDVEKLKITDNNTKVRIGNCEYSNGKFKFKSDGMEFNAKIVGRSILVSLSPGVKPVIINNATLAELSPGLILEITSVHYGTISIISHDRKFKIIGTISDLPSLNYDNDRTSVLGLSQNALTGTIVNNGNQYCFQSAHDEVRIHNKHSSCTIAITNFWHVLAIAPMFGCIKRDQIIDIFGEDYCQFYGQYFPWQYWFKNSIIGLPLNLSKISYNSALVMNVNMLNSKFYQPKVQYDRHRLIEKRLATSDLLVRERITRDIINVDALKEVKNLSDLRKFETNIKSGNPNSTFYTMIRKMGWYRHFHCYVYVVGSDNMKDRYKIGYSTESLSHLKKRYEGIMPDLKIFAIFEGYIILEHLLLNDSMLKSDRMPHATKLSEVVELPLNKILLALSSYVNTKICKLKNPIDVRDINSKNEDWYLLSIYNGDLLGSIEEDKVYDDFIFNLNVDRETIILNIIKGNIKLGFCSKNKLRELLYTLNIKFDHDSVKGSMQRLIMNHIETYLNIDRNQIFIC